MTRPCPHCGAARTPHAHRCPEAQPRLTARTLLALCLLGGALQAAVGYGCWGSAGARAQAPAPARTWLARCMVAESGWTAERDHIAIRYALHRRARRLGRSVAEQARSYCSGLGDGKPTRRQAWVRALPAEPHPDRPPPGWPAARARWDRHVPLWRAVLARAAGAPTRPAFCRRPPEHWGGPKLGADVARMQAAVAAGRWQDAGCEGTRNRFFAVVRTGGES